MSASVPFSQLSAFCKPLTALGVGYTSDKLKPPRKATQGGGAFNALEIERGHGASLVSREQGLLTD
eukprot:4980718-Pleurochrysis_carterae.AAC.2